MEYKYKLKQSIEDEKVVAHVWSRWREGSDWMKSNMLSKITKWKAHFDKKPYGNEGGDGYSQIVDDTIRNYCNTVTTHLLEPLTNTDDTIRLVANKLDTKTINAAKATQDLINYQLGRRINKVDLLDEAIKVFIKEGTVCSKVF